MAWEVCFWDRSGSDPTLGEHAGQGGGWHLHPSWVTEAFPGVHTGHLGHLGSLMGNEVASGQGRIRGELWVRVGGMGGGRSGEGGWDSGWAGRADVAQRAWAEGQHRLRTGPAPRWFFGPISRLEAQHCLQAEGSGWRPPWSGSARSRAPTTLSQVWPPAPFPVCGSCT